MYESMYCAMFVPFLASGKFFLFTLDAVRHYIGDRSFRIDLTVSVSYSELDTAHTVLARFDLRVQNKRGIADIMMIPLPLISVPIPLSYLRYE